MNLQQQKDATANVKCTTEKWHFAIWANGVITRKAGLAYDDGFTSEFCKVNRNMQALFEILELNKIGEVMDKNAKELEVPVANFSLNINKWLTNSPNSVIKLGENEIVVEEIETSGQGLGGEETYEKHWLTFDKDAQDKNSCIIRPYPGTSTCDSTGDSHTSDLSIPAYLRTLEALALSAMLIVCGMIVWDICSPSIKRFFQNPSVVQSVR